MHTALSMNGAAASWCRQQQQWLLRRPTARSCTPKQRTRVVDQTEVQRSRTGNRPRTDNRRLTRMSTEAPTHVTTFDNEEQNGTGETDLPQCCGSAACWWCHHCRQLPTSRRPPVPDMMQFIAHTECKGTNMCVSFGWPMWFVVESRNCACVCVRAIIITLCASPVAHKAGDRQYLMKASGCIVVQLHCSKCFDASEHTMSYRMCHNACAQV